MALLLGVFASSLLAAFVIAGNRFTTEQPGFVIYDLTDGITSAEQMVKRWNLLPCKDNTGW
jgi:hypothetical protein